MSYNIAKQLIASELKAQLATLVTDAMKTAAPEEQELIQLAGQNAHVVLSDIDDESLVDFQAYGSDTPSTGTGTFFISLNYKPLRTLTKPEVTKTWTPDQGPLALRTPTEDTNTKTDTSSV